MVAIDNVPWELLEKRSAGLFLFASVLLLATGVYRGAAFLMADITFNLTIGNIVLLGRLSVLLALGGFSVHLVKRNPRLGKLSRAVVSVAIVSTVILLALAVLAGVGITTPIIDVFGLATFVLSVVTYLLFGVGILRTGALSPLVGKLMVAASLALVVVFIGMMFVPVNLIGTVIEGVLSAIYLALGLHLRSRVLEAPQPEPTGETTS